MDYNESTPLPSPQSDDELSELMGHASPTDESLNFDEAFLLPNN